MHTCKVAASVLVWFAMVVVVVASDVTIPRVPNPPLDADLASLPGDLRAVAVPEPPNLNEFVKTRQAAIALGKALFWDMQVGQRRRAGLRELPLPRRRRSAIEEPGEPGLEARARPGPHLLDGTVRTISSRPRTSR